MPEEKFLKIKKKNIGVFLMGLNSLDFITNYFVDNYFEDFLFIDILDILENITVDEVEERLRTHIDPDNIVLSIINSI